MTNASASNVRNKKASTKATAMASTVSRIARDENSAGRSDALLARSRGSGLGTCFCTKFGFLAMASFIWQRQRTCEYSPSSTPGRDQPRRVARQLPPPCNAEDLVFLDG